MMTRSQRHLREIRGYDSNGLKRPGFGPPPAITGSTPPTATLAAAGIVGRTVATIAPVGGTAPFTYALTTPAGLSAAFTPNTSAVLTTTVNPCGTAGVKNCTVTITDSRGQTRSHALAVTLS